MKTLLIGLLLAGHGGACAAAVFSVRVADREIPVVEHWVRGRLNSAYAHLTVGERVEVAVTLPAGAQRWTLSPLSLGIPTTTDAEVLRFHLVPPRYLVLTVDGQASAPCRSTGTAPRGKYPTNSVTVFAKASREQPQRDRDLGQTFLTGNQRVKLDAVPTLDHAEECR